MELAFVGNAVLFLGALGVQFGLFDGAQSEDDASADTAEADSGTAEAEIVPIDVRGTTDDDGGTETAAPGDSDPDDYDPDDYASEVSGTDGDDTQAYESGPTPVAYFLHDGDDELDASPGEDFADGGAGNDTLRMRLGDDIAVGGDGDDTIDGGLGSDSLWGGAGQDSIAGNKGDDMLLGDAGNDTLTSSLGDDSLYGGTGDDQLYGDVPSLQGEWADGSDMLVGGEGDDSLHVAGGGDRAEGGEGADNFIFYDPLDGETTSQITDFDIAEDMIGIVYMPQVDPVTGDPVDPVISVTPTDDGTGAVLSVDGVEIGTITGGQSLTAGDIALIPA